MIGSIRDSLKFAQIRSNKKGLRLCVALLLFERAGVK